MENLKLWWSFIKYSTKLNGEAANSLRNYYVQRCKELTTNFEPPQLPKQNFGPSIMCSFCGSLWSKNKFQIKILPGKGHSKSVKQIIKAHSTNNYVSKFQTTLMKKSLKNKMNKIIIKCSVCSQNTKICCNKPKKLTISKKRKDETSVSISQKKKKKRKRDKTAGLNLSNIKSPHVNEKKEILSAHSTPTSVSKPKTNEPSSIKKLRKISLGKLNNVLNTSKVKKSKMNLSTFLQELY